MTILYDAAYAPAAAPAGAEGFLIYIGGDTPNPISTDAQIAAYGHLRYWLPTWVRSNPAAANALTDANQTLQWLIAHNAPSGIAVVLDLETAQDNTYVNAYGTAMHSAGFKVWPYGSKGSLFGNPALDGYFVSDPTGTDHLVTGSVATQFAFGGTYDLDDIANTGALWDTQAGAQDMPLTAADIPIIQQALAGDFGQLVYGDSKDAAMGQVTQGHPFNLYQIYGDVEAIKGAVLALTSQLNALTAAVAKIPTTAVPTTLSGTTAAASVTFK